MTLEATYAKIMFLLSQGSDRSRLRQVDAHIDRWRNLPELAVNNPKTSESALYMPYVWQSCFEKPDLEGVFSPPKSGFLIWTCQI